MKAKEIMEQTLGNPYICVAVLAGPVDLIYRCFYNAKITQLETLVSDVAGKGPNTQHGTHVARLIFGQHNSNVHGI